MKRRSGRNAGGARFIGRFGSGGCGLPEWAVVRNCVYVPTGLTNGWKVRRRLSLATRRNSLKRGLETTTPCLAGQGVESPRTPSERAVHHEAHDEQPNTNS